MDAREQKGLMIAATAKLERNGDRMWLVPSQTTAGARYAVFQHEGETRCSCPDHQDRGVRCKHMIAVEIVVKRERTHDGETVTKTMTVTETIERKTYSQDWTNYNKAQVNEHRHFQTLLADLCSTLPPLAPKPGRPRINPSDSAYCAVLKVYSTMSARRFMGDLEESKTAGHISRIPHFNSVLNFFDTYEASKILNDFVGMSAAPLAAVESDFAVDATGFSTSRYLQWVDEKWGQPKRQAVWMKVHAICGVRTNVVTAATVTDKDYNDSPMLPGLIEETNKRFTIREVSADKAYGGRSNFAAVDTVGGTFYPAFKVTARGGKTGPYAKAFHMFSMNRDEYLTHYHKRSNVESTFSAIKRKFGEHLKCKTDRAVKNEALAKIIAHNITCVISAMYELGVNPVMGCTNTHKPAQILPRLG